MRSSLESAPARDIGVGDGIRSGIVEDRERFLLSEPNTLGVHPGDGAQAFERVLERGTAFARRVSPDLTLIVRPGFEPGEVVVDRVAGRFAA